MSLGLKERALQRHSPTAQVRPPAGCCHRPSRRCIQHLQHGKACPKAASLTYGTSQAPRWRLPQAVLAGSLVGGGSMQHATWQGQLKNQHCDKGASTQRPLSVHGRPSSGPVDGVQWPSTEGTYPVSPWMGCCDQWMNSWMTQNSAKPLSYVYYIVIITL